MTVTQRLMRPGTFRLSLKPNAPYSISSIIDVLDHIVITPNRLLGVPFSDATMLGQALYTGVVEKRPGRTTIEGCDPSWWLGTPNGRGVITTAISQASAATLSTWLGVLLPFNGITAGAVNNTGLATHAGSYLHVTRREALDTICRLAGAEWRMRPNFTVDASVGSSLFRTTDPSVVITRRKGGSDGGRFGLETEMLNAGRDAANLATAAVVVAPTGTATATSATTYRTPSNGAPDLAMTVEGSSVAAGNLSGLATSVLASAGALKTDVTVSTRSHYVPLRITPGDWVWMYDPETGLIDGANAIFYRGEAINPARVRCFAITWPVTAGMGVYVRRSAATPVYTDISDWVAYEDDATFWEIGTADTPFDNVAPSPARLGANPDVAAINRAPVDYAASILVRQPGTIAATVNEARFIRDGRVVDAWFDVTVTGAGTAGGLVTVSLPIASSGHAASGDIGIGMIFDASTAIRYISALELVGGDRVAFVTDVSAGNGWGGLPNLAVANGDILRGHVRYVVA